MKILFYNSKHNKNIFIFSVHKIFKWLFYGLIFLMLDEMVISQDLLYRQGVKTNELGEEPANQCPQEFQFLCADGTECIAQYDVCDGIAQCSDRSDERNCHNQ